MALDKAVVSGMLPKNVASYVELPSKPSSSIIEVLTKEESAAIRNAASEMKDAEIEAFNKARLNKRTKAAKRIKPYIGSKVAEAISLALDTGLRRGEVLGLSWEDVDLENERLFVRHNLVETSVGKIFQTPKSDDGIRFIPLLPGTVKMLSDMKVATTSSYVFSQRNGQPMSPRFLSKLYKKVCVKAGIKNTRFHSLRHTHGTELVEAGVDTKVVADRLGHADIRTTLNIYVHPSEDFHKQELLKLENNRNKAIS